MGSWCCTVTMQNSATSTELETTDGAYSSRGTWVRARSEKQSLLLCGKLLVELTSADTKFQGEFSLDSSLLPRAMTHKEIRATTGIWAHKGSFVSL